MIDTSLLAKVCRILNKHGVTYAVAGGYACALTGHIRMTEDIDILLQDDDDNLILAIAAIREIFPNITDDISPRDIHDNVVLKIVDDIEVDLSIKAWTVDYAGAQKDISHTKIEDIDIPFLGIESLIKSKETLREIDLWDVKVLREIQKKKSGK